MAGLKPSRNGWRRGGRRRVLHQKLCARVRVPQGNGSGTALPIRRCAWYRQADPEIATATITPKSRMALIKRMAVNDKLDFDTAKVLISEHRKQERQATMMAMTGSFY